MLIVLFLFALVEGMNHGVTDFVSQTHPLSYGIIDCYVLCSHSTAQHCVRQESLGRIWP